MTRGTDTDQGERWRELAVLWPRLEQALPRDASSSGVAAGRSSKGATSDGPLGLNVDVAEARAAIAAGLQRIADEIVPLLRLDPRRPRSAEYLLQVMPGWHAELERRGQPLAQHIAGDLRGWLGKARGALRLRTGKQGIGWQCPHHRDRPAELVREPAEAQLSASILAGQGQRRGADGRPTEAPLTWRWGAGVYCPSCHERWAGVAQMRTLMAMIEQANTTAAARLLDGPAVAQWLGIAPDTVRKWAMRGAIARRGVDDRGRNLYDLEEVVQYAQRRQPGPGRRPTEDVRDREVGPPDT